MRYLSPTDRARLAERYGATGSVARVAKEFGIDRRTAARHLNRNGITTVHRMSAQEIALATTLYEAGTSAATIGRTLGFDGQTVLRALRSVGVSIRPPA